MSAVFQLDTRTTLIQHRERLQGLERWGSVWIVVGTIGVDGVDDLITPDSPPFENGWTHSLGDDPPVGFTIIGGWVHLRGGYVGGGNFTTVFTLPVGYRPKHRQRFICGTALTNHYATYYIEPTGAVVFGQVV